MAKIYGRAIAVSGGAVPSIFGDGSDGDLIVRNGETKTLEVPVPHQSVVEMQYNSILIEAGGTLTCAEPNAGLVLRCKGDCTIQGTIDQSCKAPKTNPNNNYDYPAELQCGDGGNGGNVGAQSSGSPHITIYGGTGMTARKYGGGYSGGGAGGVGYRYGGEGGDANGITVEVETIFQGGAGSSNVNAAGSPGSYGGGGGGGISSEGNSGSRRRGGNGGTGPGTSGESVNTSSGTPGGGGGGGAGNVGGGVLLLYVGGALELEGSLLCNGGQGGNGGSGGYGASSNSGSGGGGAGGGAIYIVHNAPTITNTASLQVNGGAAGSGKESATAGTIGSITIKQYEKGMTA